MYQNLGKIIQLLYMEEHGNWFDISANLILSAYNIHKYLHITNFAACTVIVIYSKAILGFV